MSILQCSYICDCAFLTIFIDKLDMGVLSILLSGKIAGPPL